MAGQNVGRWRLNHHCASCRKGAYLSRKEARKAARAHHPGEALSAYRCPVDPGSWHYGHAQPGDRDRRSILVSDKAVAV